MANLEKFVGASVESEEVRAFLGTLDRPRCDRFADMDILEYPDAGLAVYLNRDRHIVSVFLYGVQKDDHSVYDGQLPRGIAFADGKAEVGERLGTPSLSGGVVSADASWDRFDFDELSIHVQDRLGGRAIEMLTLMSPAMARGDV